MSDQWRGVSARGVLDGEPGALAGLCDSRGPSVVGYCATVCGPERAIEAAIAAFMAFRAVAARETDPLSIDAEAVLLGRTRASAAQRAPKPAGSLVYADVPCTQLAALLAENATGSLSAADRDRLRRHLARCVSCRATQGVQQEAERAYFHPPSEVLDPISRQEIIEALGRSVTSTSANGHRPVAPARPSVPAGAPPPAEPSMAAPPQSTPAPPESAPPPVSAPALRQASVAAPKPRVPQPLRRTVPMAGAALTSTPVGPSPTPPRASPVAPAPPGPSAPVGHQPTAPPPPAVGAAGPGTEPGHPHETVAPVSAVQPDQHAGGHQAAPPGGVAQAGPVGFADQDTPPNGMPAAAEWDSPTGVMSSVELNAALGYGEADAGEQAGEHGWPDAGGAPGAPPPSGDRTGRRRSTAAPFTTTGASRGGAARVLGPIAVLVVGLLIALFVAGVFSGGGHHTSTNPLAGAQTDPSTAVPSTSGVKSSGVTSSGVASSGVASNGGSSTAAASSAASKRAAKKRAQELARRLQTGGATQTATAGTKPTTTSTATGPGTSHTQTAAKRPPATPVTKPVTNQTTKPSTPVKPKPTGASTVHELGTGSGSARPVTGVPATGVTGYQPG